MPKLIVLLFLALFIPASTDVDKLIRNGNFTETHQKMNVPLEVWKRIGVNHYDEIANPGEPWESGCTRMEGVPGKRMNWAAHDVAGNWIVSTSTGGWAVITNVNVVTKNVDQPVTTFNSSPEDSTLAIFRRNYSKGFAH